MTTTSLDFISGAAISTMESASARMRARGPPFWTFAITWGCEPDFITQIRLDLDARGGRVNLPDARGTVEATSHSRDEAGIVSRQLLSIPDARGRLPLGMDYPFQCQSVAVHQPVHIVTLK